MKNPELDQAFAKFDWENYFAKLNANPQGNVHANCDHAYGYCAATPTNTFTPKGK